MLDFESAFYHLCVLFFLVYHFRAHALERHKLTTLLPHHQGLELREIDFMQRLEEQRGNRMWQNKRAGTRKTKEQTFCMLNRKEKWCQR